jgi:Tol biopolymer transport system component
MSGTSWSGGCLLPGIKVGVAQTDETPVRIGVVFVTAAVGVLAAAFALLPLVLRPKPAPYYPTPAKMTSSFWAIPLDGGKPRLVARLKGQYDDPVVSADGRSLLVLKPTMLRRETAVWSLPVDGGSPRWVGRAQYFGPPMWSPDRKLLAAGDISPGREIALYDLAGHRVRTITRLRGEGGASAPSWGGDNIAFVRMTHPASGWHLDVEVWRAKGGLVWSMPLAYPDGSVALAPDGRRIALLQVHRLQLLTRHSRRLLATDAAPFALPVWTPNGRRLVYFDLKRRLLVQDVTSGSRRVLATGLIAEPSVSPDGRTVYVAAFRGAKPAVSIPK